MSDIPENAGVLARLPEELHYLIEPALRFDFYSEQQIIDFLDGPGGENLDELAAIAEKVRLNGHYEMVNKFLDEYDMVKYSECFKLYFFFGILDHAGLTFD